MTELIPIVLGGVGDAHERLRARLRGLTRDEYFWEPVPGMWSVRLEDGTWVPHPNTQSGPPATIAWRVWHVAECLAGYVTPHLGEWPLAASDGTWHGEVDPALADLETSWRVFAERIRGLGEDGIRRPLGPAWGPFAESSWADLVVHALDEVAHHGGEIGVLRDLYPHLGQGGATMTP
ncbi:DinB family protein [Jatrophihabitans fulvus]